MTEPAKALGLLRWAGGKKWATKYLGPAFHNYLSTGKQYVEPFLGSAAMAAYLGHHNAILTDVIPDLIEFYECVQRDPARLAWALSVYATYGVDKAAYLQVRDDHPEDKLFRAARVVYLNRLSFNGLWRVNKSGKHNVPYRESAIKRKSFEALSQSLQGADLACLDFAPVIGIAEPGALIYADPPYHGVYDSYTAEGFSEFDQERLAMALWEAHTRGCKVVLHNSNTELIQHLYSDWLTVVPVDERRSIAADPSSRDHAKCVVATNDVELLGSLAC
ncbi:MAG: Dam family site-specific DNA-(adenine-N6)-methyltransferase [Deltaproteobacteria bacterium]|nr:Dam family site-specific DNA-(adenine-N6)-methyltransferase [Deltaproteobacteria bacterium]